ncbi:VOC family protein [Vibrio cincinnatiensis]|uniref:VOC family protein n=1 Tax=Vibrio cincinnatiensis TaxID=675 RepID=UPI001EDE4EBD|nr:VOC family protein [Vibrio cincinnatiensis]MCG3734343.1 VOC family protein [Vibrio cincinnatiensis]MCG3741446.1 VOC family protein [Vibrio cincinnatiensis]MCG3745150.1 VOC family protein [Vibrio cincinnatiensis]
MSITSGTHHIGLTVSQLEKSAEFFTQLLGWEEVKRRDDYPAIFVRDDKIMITLWEVQTNDYTPFNRKTNVGLHHLALQVTSKEELLKLHNHLVENGIEIEFEPTEIRQGPAIHMMCYEPSGIRIEFYWDGF